MSGYIKLHRKIFENKIWFSQIDLRLFLFLLCNAMFADRKVAGVDVRRGQFMRSFRNLQDDLAYWDNNAFKKYSLSTIKNSIGRLTEDGVIAAKPCELGTLFTVSNYESYQGFDKSDTKVLRTDCEQTANRLRTDCEQTANNNKNIQEGKEREEREGSPSQAPEKKATRLSADWVPSAAEINWATDERSDVDVPREVSKFKDYWIAIGGAAGRKLDWAATWRNWIRNAKPTKTAIGYIARIEDRSVFQAGVTEL